MPFKKTTALFACLFITTTTVFASDWGLLIEREEVPVTISFPASLWHGLRIGAVTGLSAGWVRYADESARQGVWNSTGWGAIAGLGITAGADLFKRRVTVNNILSDAGYGGKIGASAGFLLGAVAALVTSDTSRIGQNTAWGELGGTAIGLIYGSYRTALGHYTEEGGTKGLPLPFTIPVPQSFSLVPSSSGTILLTYRSSF